MKKSLTITVLFPLAFALSCFQAMAGIENTPHITVVGTAEIKTVPDEMIWNFTVTTKDQSAANVGKLHDRNVAEAISLIKKHNVEEKDIQTSNMRLDENWVYRSKSNVMEGYIATTTIVFKSNDFDSYTNLWIGLAELATAKIGGVYFDTSKRQDIQNSARLKAADAAKSKAQALCSALGSVLHEALVIEEDLGVNEGYGRIQPMRNMVLSSPSPESDASGESIAPGQISIHSRVQVTFRIAPM